MSGATGRLYLDQLQSLGVEGSGESRGYPQLSKDEMRVLTIVAQNLFVSITSMAWAFYETSRGGSDSFKGIRDRLLSPPVKMVVKD